MTMGYREASRIAERKERAWRDEFETKEPTVNGKKFINYEGGPIPKNPAFEDGFYGHVVASDFKKTRIISTNGR